MSFFFKNLIAVVLLFSVFQVGFSQSDSILYSFFVAGHVYGKPGVDNHGVHPPFQAQFPYILSRPEIEFGFFTGDIVINPSETNWDEIDADVDSLGMPVFFAVGNHDGGTGAIYSSRYGETYYYFEEHGDLFIVLNPNLSSWKISGDQLDFLTGVLDTHATSSENIFIFFHQFICWDSNNVYSDHLPNSFAGMDTTLNFWSEVMPILEDLPQTVRLFAGDCGATWKATDYMYGLYKNVELIASGMGHGPGDNFVIVNVMQDKSIDYDLIALNEPFIHGLGELTDDPVLFQNPPVLPIDIRVRSNYQPKEIIVEMKSYSKVLNLQVTDLKGRHIYSGILRRSFPSSISMEGRTPGLYVVRAWDDNVGFVRKVVVQK